MKKLLFSERRMKAREMVCHVWQLTRMTTGQRGAGCNARRLVQYSGSTQPGRRQTDRHNYSSARRRRCWLSIAGWRRDAPPAGPLRTAPSRRPPDQPSTADLVKGCRLTILADRGVSERWTGSDTESHLRVGLIARHCSVLSRPCVIAATHAVVLDSRPCSNDTQVIHGQQKVTSIDTAQTDFVFSNQPSGTPFSGYNLYAKHCSAWS